MSKTFKKIASLLLALLVAVTLVLPALTAPASALSYSGSSSYRSGKYYTALKKVQLTGDQRKDIVAVAKSQVGYQEGRNSSQLSGTVRGNGNCTEYGRWYGLQDMWCAMFVSWCANTAGVSTSIVPKHCFTPSGLSWFRSRGLAYSRSSVAAGKYTPKAGDIIYFKSSRNSNTTNHIGIVTGYSGKTVYTIEGNTSSATISTNGGAVAAKSYSIYNTYIVYICSPKYKNTASSTTTTKPTTPTQTETPKVEAGLTNDFYATISNKNLGMNLSLDGSNVLAEAKSESPEQIWRFLAQSDGSYKIVNNKNGKVLEVANSATADGTNVQVADDTGAENQRWKVKEVTGGYSIKPVCASGSGLSFDATSKNAEIANYTGAETQLMQVTKVTSYMADLGENFMARMTVADSGLSISLSGTNVITYTKSDKPAQIWNFQRQSNGTYKVVNTKTNQVLDCGNTAKNGALLEIADDDGTKSQRWYIYSYNNKFILRSYMNMDYAMDVKGDSTATLSSLQLYKFNCNSDQLFNINRVDAHVTDLGDDFYAKITNVYAGLNLSLSGTDVITYSNSDKPAQVWRFQRQDDSSYKITNTKTGQVLDVNGSVKSGAYIEIADSDNSNSQRWYIYSTNGSYMLQSKSNKDYSLQVKGGSTASETRINLGASAGGNAQEFQITKQDTHVVNLGKNFFAKISTVESKLNLSLNGTDVITYGDSEKPAQVWNFQRQSDATYMIVNTKNGKVLSVNGAAASGTLLNIADSDNSAAQRWYVFKFNGNYVLRSASNMNLAIDVKGDVNVAANNLQLYTAHGKNDQRFAITKVKAPAEVTVVTSNAIATPAQMAVIRKIIYAVETGGQVYGKADYTDFTPAYANSSAEHAITIGAGQWYGNEAKTLLLNIQAADPALFKKLDTAGIAKDLKKSSWSTYKLSSGSAKAKCIQKIIGTDVGRACQDALIEEQMKKYMQEAKDLGVKNVDALMMCANIRHQGGLGALKRVLGKTKGGYTLDNIYKAMSTDTGNQVGAYRNRQKMVYNSLKKYI